MEVGDPNSFESFMQSNPLDGEKYLKTVVEVTGIADRTIIYKAFNQSKKSNRDFDVNNAIEWILTMSENSKTGMIIYHGSESYFLFHLEIYLINIIYACYR